MTRRLVVRQAQSVDVRRRLLKVLSLLALPGIGGQLTRAAVPAAAVDPADREGAVRYLESIQRATYKSLGTEPSRPSDAFMDDFVKQLLSSPMASNMSEEERLAAVDRLRKEVLSGAHSQYEDPIGYSLISGLDAKIRKVIDGSSVRLVAPPVFGTLPTRHVNARTFAVPGSQTQVVAFEDQIWNFANLFCKSVALGIPSLGRESGNESFSTDLARLPMWLQSHPDPALRMFELLRAYIVQGVPGAAPQYFSAEPHGALAGVLRESMELFVLGHEYGHVVAGHLGAGKRVTAAIADDQFDELVRSWAHELEADAIGLQLSVQAMRVDGFDVAISYCGADLFMTALDIVERALGVLRDGREPTPQALADRASSHPPPAFRRERLRNVAAEKYGDAGKSAASFAEFTHQVVEALWKEVGPRLLGLYRQGLRPHRVWQVTAPVAARSASGVR